MSTKLQAPVESILNGLETDLIPQATIALERAQQAVCALPQLSAVDHPASRFWANTCRTWLQRQMATNQDFMSFKTDVPKRVPLANMVLCADICQATSAIVNALNTVQTIKHIDQAGGQYRRWTAMLEATYRALQLLEPHTANLNAAESIQLVNAIAKAGNIATELAEALKQPAAPESLLRAVEEIVSKLDAEPAAPSDKTEG